MKRLSLLAGVVTLSGCMSLGGLQGNPDEPFYTLDTRQLSLCKGTSRTCMDLSYIVSVRARLKPIENLYGQTVSGPNYPLTLARMLMNPPEGAYTVEQVDDDGRYIRLGRSEHTKRVWETLDQAIDSLYD
ncbi:hypothetical protein H9C73_05285 [Marinobacterium sp. AK62]|uniref:Lipoprotein n=1 Tax=Marinobacterium alkalitolerans TaxID=1542925 RepID=A0ABS3Z8V2_9GAMM|nr:hypothetical protein [Marinobacterium alkalitolerans]MBP0048140.1 hypothetical protein [Marinobacterium alkalitolerans]